MPTCKLLFLHILLTFLVNVSNVYLLKSYTFTKIMSKIFHVALFFSPEHSGITWISDVEICNNSHWLIEIQVNAFLLLVEAKMYLLESLLANPHAPHHPQLTAM